MTVDRDLNKLVPAFRERVVALLLRMQARGFDAMVWEAYRSPERAKQLAAKGVGIALSMHCLGVAVDIVSASKRWKAPATFWEALGEEAEACGLTWGGRWRRVDLPHVQAVSVGEQAAARRMKPDKLAAFVARRLAG